MEEATLVTTSSRRRIGSVGSAIWWRLRRWPVVPGFILLAIVTVAVFAPLVQTSDPRIGSLRDRRLPPVWAEEGRMEYFLGTDSAGRDIWSRLAWGARVSLTVAGVGLAAGTAVGVILGLLAGYAGGLFDELVMRAVDATMAIPTIFIALVLVVTVGQSITLLYVVLALTTWNAFARQVRGETLKLKEESYVSLAKVAGASLPRILVRHIFPGVISTILVLASLRVGQLIMLEAILSFLGAGVPPPTPSWGAMVADGRRYIGTSWWISFWPGIAILLVVLAFNFTGDWLRDRLDPKLRQI